MVANTNVSPYPIGFISLCIHAIEREMERVGEKGAGQRERQRERERERERGRQTELKLKNFISQGL